MELCGIRVVRFSQRHMLQPPTFLAHVSAVIPKCLPVAALHRLILKRGSREPSRIYGRNFSARIRSENHRLILVGENRTDKRKILCATGSYVTHMYVLSALDTARINFVD